MMECPRKPSARYQSVLNESFVSEREVAQPHGVHEPLLEVTDAAKVRANQGLSETARSLIMFFWWWGKWEDVGVVC